MKILYLCTYFHQALLYRQQMDGLISKGHSVKVFNSARIGEGIEEKFIGVIDDNVYHVECWKPLDRMLFFPRQLKIEKKLLKKYNPSEFDLMHSHLMLSSGWTARRIKKKYGLHYVVSVRVTDLIGWIKMPFFHKMAMKNIAEADGVLFLSESHRKEFLNKFASKSEQKEILAKSVVIGNPLERFWQENRARNALSLNIDEGIHVLTVARINKVKNIPMAAKAVKVLRDKGHNIDLTVVGKVEDQEELLEIQKYDFVKIVPFSNLSQLKEQYDTHSIFLLPSLVETFGRVYVEAMSQGLPILYSAGQGFDKVYPDGYVGFPVDPKDECDISKKIELIMDDYNSISEHCIKACEDYFESSIVDKIEIFYNKLLHRI